ncbi:MAG: 3'-5' exonuclease [Oleiphilus sp.]|nr:MAG: 3'-5' exonuclease [Oleiphilus sp.]
MLKTEMLSQLKQLKQEIKASRNLHQGIVKGTSNKFGFVTLDSGKDIFLPADEMARVLPGDRIEVEVKKEPKNKTFALVEKLIESPTKEFFGKYVTKGNAHFVEADISGLSQWLFIPPPKRKDAKTKDLVRCKLTQHPIRNGKAQAAVLEVIGSERDPGIEWTYAMRKYGIQEGWPEQVMSEVEALDQAAVEQLASQREDLSDVPFVTIDSASTQDMDDAIWVEKRDQAWVLRVAIADPASLIPENSALEKELCRRVASVYFPGLAVPMLPAELSRDLCSLREGVLRLAKVLELVIDAKGEVIESRLFNARVCSQRKLSYQEASALVATGSDDPLQPMLRELNELSNVLSAWRKDKAVCQAGRPEFYLEINDNRKIERIVPREPTVAHRIVEECMVVANRTIAQLLQSHNVDSLFVRHDGVREERRQPLASVLAKATPDLGEVDLADLNDFGRCMRTLQESDEYKQLVTLINRQLTRTELSSRPAPHFAMGFDAYTTFTSPLRKASDFLLHRQLDAWLKEGEIKAIDSTLASSLDVSLQNTRAAVFEVEQWLKCQFMNTRSNIFEAQVLRVYASGCQIRLLENGVEGFISVRDLDGKFSYNQDLMQLKGADYSFSLDQLLKVKKKQVDWSRKQIMFIPCETDA